MEVLQDDPDGIDVLCSDPLVQDMLEPPFFAGPDQVPVDLQDPIQDDQVHSTLVGRFILIAVEKRVDDIAEAGMWVVTTEFVPREHQHPVRIVGEGEGPDGADEGVVVARGSFNEDASKGDSCEK